MQQMLWVCKSCRTSNPLLAPKCTVCRRRREGDEVKVPVPEIRAPMKTDPEVFAEREEASKRRQRELVELGRRLRDASGKLESGPESIPPRGAVRIVVPNNWTGWVVVALVVLGLALAIAVIKSLLPS